MKSKPVGVTLGWSMKPQLVFEDGLILISPEADRILYPKYFQDDMDWPIDPDTGEALAAIAPGRKP